MTAKPQAPSVFLGAWIKGHTGLEASARIIHGLIDPGDRTDLVAQICTPSEVRYLIQFLHENYPEAWRDYQAALAYASSRGLAKPKTEWPDDKWQALSSDRHTTYMVGCENDRWTCSCTGFSYRRRCRHIDERKTKLKAGIGEGTT